MENVLTWEEVLFEGKAPARTEEESAKFAEEILELAASPPQRQGEKS